MPGMPEISVAKDAVKAFAPKPAEGGMPTGEAKMGDVAKFQQVMGDGMQTQQPQQGMQAESVFSPKPGGPFSFDSLLNYTQQHRAGGVQAGGEGTGKMPGMEQVSKLFNQGKEMDAQIQDVLKATESGGELSTADTLMLQYSINQGMISVEVVGKGVSQLVKAAQTPIRGQ